MILPMPHRMIICTIRYVCTAGYIYLCTHNMYMLIEPCIWDLRKHVAIAYELASVRYKYYIHVTSSGGTGITAGNLTYA